MILLLISLQALFLLAAGVALWANRSGDGPYHALQLGLFGWMIGASELGRLALGWVGEAAAPGVFGIVGLLGLLLGLIVHLTQFERSRKDEGATPLSPGPSWLIAAAYLLGAVSWAALLAVSSLPPAGVLGAMGALAVVVASVVLLLAVLTLGLTRGRPGPWAAGGMAVAVLASALGLLVAA